jgi:hypothetical protein
MHAMLPTETQEWCDQQLSDLQFNPATATLEHIGGRENPFLEIYCELTARVSEHIELGRLPQLDIRSAPVGGWSFEDFTVRWRLLHRSSVKRSAPLIRLSHR